MKKLISKHIPPLRAWKGIKTEKLVRSPGGFGLGQVPTAQQPDATTNIVCGFCATGCGLNVHLKDGQAINLTPSTDYPVNLGMACPKGWEALTPLAADDRATTPMIRRKRGGELEAIGWQEAMDHFCKKTLSVQEKHGKEAMAFISTGQICTEEMAFLGSLTKFGMGMLHGDGNTRQCMATAVTAYKQSFGFDAPPYTYQDFEESDVIVLIGSNLCIAHPIMWQRVLMNKNSPEIVVVDPRKTETAVASTQHYPIQPKSDLVFFYGIAHILIENGWVDHDYIDANTREFNAFAEHVQSFPPKVTSALSGIPESELHRLAQTIHEGKRVSFWWTMGVNQGYEATRTAQAIINLALLTGNIGRPGTGANSITGQCNAMGSRLFSNTTNLLGGHDFTNAHDRGKVANILDIPVENIPDKNSLAYDQIIQGIEDGTIKGLWMIATNGAHSWIHQKRFRHLLDKLDFLVVQDMYHNTESAAHADLILPAASWAEKDGTFINSERRIGLVKKVCRAPGIALSDFSIFQLIANAWGCANLFKGWTSPEAVFQILKHLSKGQPCDFSGVDDYQMLDSAGGIQWPFTENDSLENNQRRLFEDGKFYHLDHKAVFLFESPRDNPEPIDEAFPFLLLTGRGTSAQWHTQTRTSKSAVLRKLYPASIYAEINPEDAHNLGLEANDRISITSRRGAITAAVWITPTVQRGQIFLPMHYEETNQLTHNSVDPHSRQPNYKSCAVRIGRSHMVK